MHHEPQDGEPEWNGPVNKSSQFEMKAPRHYWATSEDWEIPLGDRPNPTTSGLARIAPLQAICPDYEGSWLQCSLESAEVLLSPSDTDELVTLMCARGQEIATVTKLSLKTAQTR